ncbi:MAG: ROK family protein [Myxococcota bacterium]
MVPFRSPAAMRLRVPRATPLEIWRLELETGDTFSRAVRRKPERILEGLLLLHSGRGQTRDGRTDHHICAGYAHLVIGGGRAVAVDDAILAQGPTGFTRLPDAFIGESGGHALAAQHGFRPEETMVVDLGQTAIKVSYAGRRCRLPRDQKRLPRGRVASSRQSEQRDVLRDFLADAIHQGRAGQAAPGVVIFALPGEVAASATPGKSTYAGTRGYAGLCWDALLAAGTKPKMVGVLNDAELAAASASQLPEALGKTLVITLGFGLGASLLAPASP